MPGRYYMGIDYRPDHSFRIPRPDLSTTIGTPNVCNRCHVDKTNEWSNEFITKWYGPSRRAHYGNIIDAGRRVQPEPHDDLIKLAGDKLYPVIVRATALSLLGSYPGEKTTQIYKLALMDDEALIRRTALHFINMGDIKTQTALLASMLYDPVKAVRTEAASRMASIAKPQLDSSQNKVYQSALGEYINSMEYSGDFAFGRYNLGNLYVALNQTQKAIDNYRAAINIDNLFYPAMVNLAMLYNQRKENDEAEKLLRQAIAGQPELHEVHYSLGLLLAEQKNYEEAEHYLAKAANGMPARARIHYNLGLLQQYIKKDAAAEASLITALELEPDQMDFLYALADFYVKRGRLLQARQIAEQMIARHPQNATGHNLMNFINSRIQTKTEP
jgi:Tfp pilus assembly protein PilF